MECRAKLAPMLQLPGFCRLLLLLSAVFLGWWHLSVSSLDSASDTGQQNAKWTLMFFMDCDNDLEKPQMENILALARSGAGDSIRVMMLVDRSSLSETSEGYTDEDVLNLTDWEGAKLFEVQKGRLKELEDWGEINMGDPQNLVKFVEKATTVAPAERYALVFGDHGSSWPGFNGDGSHDGDSISLAEIQVALGKITQELGRLDLIHYDNCLMSCVENLAAIAPYTEWITASAELVPGDGCDYESILNLLKANPDADGRELGEIVVQTFRDFYEKSKSEDRRNAGIAITMALIDADEIQALSQEVKALAVATNGTLSTGGRDAYLRAARARSAATEFGRQSSDQPGAGVLDLVDYCRLLQKEYGAGPIGDAAEKTIGQVKRTVVMEIHGKGLPRSRGVSIYLPQSAESFKKDGAEYPKTSFAQQSGWDKMLSSLFGTQKNDANAPPLQPVRASTAVVKTGGEATFTSNLKADDLDEAYFVIALAEGDDRIVIGQLPTEVKESGEMSETWDGQWLYLENGKEQMICPIDDLALLDEDDPDGEILAIAPLQIRKGNKGEWIDVTATFLLDFSDEDGVTGELVYAFRESQSGSREMSVVKGDVIRPVFLVIDKEGNEEYAPAEGAEFELPVLEAGLAVLEDRVPDGSYLMGFRVVDFADNVAEESIKVTVGQGAAAKR